MTNKERYENIIKELNDIGRWENKIPKSDIPIPSKKEEEYNQKRSRWVDDRFLDKKESNVKRIKKEIPGNKFEENLLDNDLMVIGLVSQPETEIETIIPLFDMTNILNEKHYEIKDQILSSISNEFKPGTIFINNKTGNSYKIINIAKRANNEIPKNVVYLDVVYTRIEDNIPEIYTRELSEFLCKFRRG